MNLLKYKSDNDFSKNGWVILNYSTFKIHVNKDRNIREIYSNNSFSDDDVIALDELFEKKLKFIKPLLLDIGINFHSLTENKIENCFYVKAEIRPSVYHILTFRFFGILSNKSKESEFKPKIELSETYHNILYKITFDTIVSENDKLSLKIEFTE